MNISEMQIEFRRKFNEIFWERRFDILEAVRILAGCAYVRWDDRKDARIRYRMLANKIGVSWFGEAICSGCGWRMIKRSESDEKCIYCLGERRRPNRPKIFELRSQASGMLKSKEWEQRKALYGNRCACCLVREEDQKLELDHIRPLTKGGDNEIENTQPLCKKCNLKKRTKTIVYPFNLSDCTTSIA